MNKVAKIADNAKVFVIDDDDIDRLSLTRSLTRRFFQVIDYVSAEDFLKQVDPLQPGCLVLDIRMPGTSGNELQQQLAQRYIRLPIIFVSGVANVEVATYSMKLGALDVLEKPVDEKRLCELVKQACDSSISSFHKNALCHQMVTRLELLTNKEREVLPHVCAGRTLKEITKVFGVTLATAARHQNRILEKLEAANTTLLVRQFQEADFQAT